MCRNPDPYPDHDRDPDPLTLPGWILIGTRIINPGLVGNKLDYHNKTASNKVLKRI